MQNVGSVKIVFEISEELLPLCLAHLFRKLTYLSAFFEALSAVYPYRHPEVIPLLDGGAELWS